MNCSWLDDAVDDAERLRTVAGPAVGGRVGSLLDRLASMNGGQGLRDALLRSGSTPFVRLIDVVARDLGLAADDARVGFVGRSTVLLYVYVRIQDDLVDEEDLVDRTSVFAMEAALSSHLDLLARATLSDRAWRVRSRLMMRFADIAAEEADARLHSKTIDAERTGEKFLAMAVPLIALVSIAQREDLVDALTSWVEHAGTALQMINDVLNAAEDHAAGRITPVLQWMGAAEITDTNVVRAALLGDPACARALALARARAAEAMTVATSSGLPGLADLSADIARHIDRTEERLLGLMLGVQA